MAEADAFIYGDDFDAILAAIEDNLLEEDKELSVPVTDIVDEVVADSIEEGFKCDQCEKICKTSRGLTRHKNSKHGPTSEAEPHHQKPENQLHPLYLKKYIGECASKLALDECYSEETRKGFLMFQKPTLDDARYTFKFIKDVVASFKNNSEKFYASFYKCVSENIVFKNLSKRASVILGFELANYVLAHLTGSVVNGDIANVSPGTNFSPKEKQIIKYLAGYVFGTLYRRIRRSKQSRSILNLQSIHLLIAGKSTDQEHDTEINTLVRIKDRGGLWTVTSEVFEIFSIVESHFRQESSTTHRSIDSKKMVSYLMNNARILCNYNKLKNASTEEVSKEIALNLLEHLIMLYIRVRVYSLVKDKCQRYNVKSKAKKSRSLRTEVKKASSTLDHGH
ncbi:uncharacterized protein LOC130629219 [Hydractinia symbiolongicarpus]|uniref:uncharacterized protein LOC130629219 n=1 Tax=Hydractinia symbiolongicarpus TaxID=13093 RepID=UPI00254DA21C|nr:uncharacterized protein LOC130629219 [Hydractinia symbiolongicarpus]